MSDHVTARKIVTTKYFKGLPKLTDFKIVEETLPALEDREILTEALWISVDPYQRIYTQKYPIGATVIAFQVAKVLQSRHPNFKEGALVSVTAGWQTKAVVKPDDAESLSVCLVLPEFGDVSLSMGVGAVGMPGNTAHFGFLEICQPKRGEVVVVSAAAGAVGSHVCQIAKHLGCVVIGLAGSKKKIDWLLNELKLDAAINYKSDDIPACLAKAAPKGIDCYFDNVGGELSSTILLQMNDFGRVSVCGSISCYNDDFWNPSKAPAVQPMLITKNLKMEGFVVTRWRNRWMEGVEKNLEAVKEGWLKCPEHTFQGFDKLPEAFISMLQGENLGKTVVKI